MRQLGAIVVLLALVIWAAHSGSAQFSVAMGRNLAGAPSIRTSCVQDEDAKARIRDEILLFARSHTLSEQELSRRVDANASALEQFGCVAEVSGSTVPMAMLAVDDFKAFLAAQGRRGAAELLARWAALCGRAECKAIAKKVRNELPEVAPSGGSAGGAIRHVSGNDHLGAVNRPPTPS